MTFVPGEEELALGCPRGARKLTGLSQGGQNAMSQGVGCRWQIVPWGSKLSQYVPRGLTLFLRVVLGGLKFMSSVGGVGLLNGIAHCFAKT